MFNRFQRHIDSDFPFLKNASLLVATSGGVDSMVLTELCRKLDFDIALAHCNFKLRTAESDDDEAFIRSYAKTHNLKLHVTHFDTQNFSTQTKQSIQMAARQLRYDWFERLKEEFGYDYILTAHHADDNLETFLINLSRGTGLEGLIGIPAVNNSIVRPLLFAERDHILDYANTHAIQWREDRTNTDINYLRNQFRHQIVPILKSITPSFLDNFKRSQSYFKDTQTVVKDRIDQIAEQVIDDVTEGEIKFNSSKIKALNNPKAYLYFLLKGYDFTDWDEIFKLLDAQSGKQILSPSYRLLKNREHLILSRSDVLRQSDILISSTDTNVPIPLLNSCLIFESVEMINDKSKQVFFVDNSKLKYPLLVRHWRDGDYFYPVGMTGKKKLSKYFKDEKLSLNTKEKTLVLCSENKIVGVLGMRADQRFHPSNYDSIIKIALQSNATCPKSI